MKFFPELNYWIYTRYFESPINEYHFEFPIELSSTRYWIPTSVFSLLFDDSFNETSYSIMFNRITFESITESILSMRLSRYRSDLEIFINTDSSSSVSVNALDIDSEEEELLDVLFHYRTDSLDTSAELNVIVYDNLQSGLSKLIYIYLQLMVNNNIEIYNNSDVIANHQRLLEVVFEKYLIDAYFRKIKGEYIALDSTTKLRVVNLVSITEVVLVTQQDLDNKQFLLQHIPFYLEDIELLQNGIKKYVGQDFTVVKDGSIAILNWYNYTMESNLQVGDKLFITYSYEGPFDYHHEPVGE